jgi:hypothetical protein
VINTPYRSGRTKFLGWGTRHTTLPEPAGSYDGALIHGPDGIYESRQGSWVMIIAELEIEENNIGVVDVDRTITVGPGSEVPGSHYNTIGNALAHLSRYQPVYRSLWYASNPLEINIEIQAGFVVQEQLFLRGIDIGFVNLRSVDPVVTVNGESLIRRDDPVQPHHEFIRFAAQTNGFRLQTIFRSDGGIPDPDPAFGTYTPRTIGVRLTNTSTFACASYKRDPLDTYHREAGLQAFSWNGRLQTGSILSATGATFDDAVDIGVQVGAGATLSFFRSVVRNCGNIGANIFGALAFNGAGGVYGDYPDYRQDFRRIAGTDTSSDMVFGFGGNSFIWTGVRGGTNLPPNQYTKDGFVLDQRSVQPMQYPGIPVLESYTLATLPSAAANTRAMIWVTNGDSGNPCLAVSDGTNWKRISLGANL